MEYSWHPDDGSEAQNIIRQAEAPPDSPFRPRYRRRSGEIANPVAGFDDVTGTIPPPGRGGFTTAQQAIKLGVLLGKKPVADALSRFLTLRDVFKIGVTCRELMRRLLIVGDAAGGAGVSAPPELAVQQQPQQVAAAAPVEAGAAKGVTGAGAAAGGGAVVNETGVIAAAAAAPPG